MPTFSMDMPFFLKDESWFTEEFDSDGKVTYHLTDDAPKEARESLEEYQRHLNGITSYTDEDGNNMIPEGWSAY